MSNGAPLDPPLLDLMVAGLRTFKLVQPTPRRMSDDELQEISVPTLLLFGERSPVNDPARVVPWAQRALRDCVTEVLPGVGHMVPVENPDEFTSSVLRFVTDVEARLR